jgi:hypothetical protein
MINTLNVIFSAYFSVVDPSLVFEVETITGLFVALVLLTDRWYD